MVNHYAAHLHDRNNTRLMPRSLCGGGDASKQEAKCSSIGANDMRDARLSMPAMLAMTAFFSASAVGLAATAGLASSSIASRSAAGRTIEPADPVHGGSADTFHKSTALTPKKRKGGNVNSNLMKALELQPGPALSLLQRGATIHTVVKTSGGATAKAGAKAAQLMSMTSSPGHRHQHAEEDLSGEFAGEAEDPDVCLKLCRMPMSRSCHALDEKDTCNRAYQHKPQSQPAIKRCRWKSSGECTTHSTRSLAKCKPCDPDNQTAAEGPVLMAAASITAEARNESESEAAKGAQGTPGNANASATAAEAAHSEAPVAAPAPAAALPIANYDNVCDEGYIAVGVTEGVSRKNTSSTRAPVDRDSRCHRLCRPLMGSCPSNLHPLRETGEDAIGTCLTTRCVSTEGALRLLAHGYYQAWRYGRNPKTGLYLRSLSLNNIDAVDWEIGDTAMTGLGLAFECAANALNFTQLKEAQEKVLLTMRSLTGATSGVVVDRKIGGCFASTINTNSGDLPDTEACDTGRTGTLLAGALFARAYFRNAAPSSSATREISYRVMQLFDSVRWHKIASCEPGENGTWVLVNRTAVASPKEHDAPSKEHEHVTWKVPSSVNRKGVCHVPNEPLKVSPQALFLHIAYHHACGRGGSEAKRGSCRGSLVAQQFLSWQQANLTIGGDFWHGYFIEELLTGQALQGLAAAATAQMHGMTEDGALKPIQAVDYLMVARRQALPHVLRALADAEVLSKAKPEYIVLRAAGSAPTQLEQKKEKGHSATGESDLNGALFGLSTFWLGTEWWHNYAQLLFKANVS